MICLSEPLSMIFFHNKGWTKGRPQSLSVYFSLQGLDQGSTLIPYLYTVFLDLLTKHIQYPGLRCMGFVDDVVLIGESRQELNGMLETWSQVLEA